MGRLEKRCIAQSVLASLACRWHARFQRALLLNTHPKTGPYGDWVVGPYGGFKKRVLGDGGGVSPEFKISKGVVLSLSACDAHVA